MVGVSLVPHTDIHLAQCACSSDKLKGCFWWAGANLSNTYFSNRQDRYYLFRDAPLLANHIRSLVQVGGVLLKAPAYLHCLSEAGNNTL